LGGLPGFFSEDPAERVLFDLLADSGEIVVAADDVVVVPALPQARSAPTTPPNTGRRSRVHVVTKYAPADE
jgi:hypothetical protein